MGLCACGSQNTSRICLAYLNLRSGSKVYYVIISNTQIAITQIIIHILKSMKDVSEVVRLTSHIVYSKVTSVLGLTSYSMLQFLERVKL